MQLTSPLASVTFRKCAANLKSPPYMFVLAKYIPMFFPCFSYLLIILVDGGHRAVIFDRFQGVRPDVVGEGTHFLVPWVQKPIIFDIRSRPRNVPTITGSKGMYQRLLLPTESEFGRKGIYLFAAEQYNGLPLQARKVVSQLLFRQFLEGHCDNIQSIRSLSKFNLYVGFNFVRFIWVLLMILLNK